MTDRSTALLRRLQAMDTVDLDSAVRVRGFVSETGDGVAQVIGLPDVGADELLIFDSGATGMAYDIAPEATGVMLLSNAEGVGVTEGVSGTGGLPTLRVGPALLGRVVDPLGLPLDDLPAPVGEPRVVLRDAPELTARASIRRPLHTGVMSIDSAIPIGRGQRQLILGDRNVGKTALALDIVAAQKHTGVLCVFVVIGQPLSRVLAIREGLLRSGSLAHTVVVAAEAADTPAMQYLAPYAGATVAEYFRERGSDTLVVYDDLTKHADAYRELALLLGRPPGREAFPGDIFYLHGELLERASAFAERVGGGSITAFPIVETIDGDISAYIPTNLISITDGQIYLDTARFERNLRPAIDVGRSVSRIGGVAQPDTLRGASKNLRIQIARFEALETMTRVGLDVDPATQATLERGRILRELLRQPRFTLRTVADQALALRAVVRGLVDGLSPARARELVWQAGAHAREATPHLVETLDAGTRITDEDWERLLAIVSEQVAEAGQ